jgi:hypothetical protein
MKFGVLLGVTAFAKSYPEWFQQKLNHADRSDGFDACDATSCEQPSRKYSKMLPMQPGIQWNQHGGYCGAWSFQRAALAKGAYISQQQVRDHAEFGGGHDEEILNTNIDSAFEKLHIRHDNFEFNVLPTPQSTEYLKFMKKHLVADNPVIWMVMFDGDSSPTAGYTMDNTTNGIYGHVEPVVGIMSDHDLSDGTVYDDDVFAYFDDASKTTHYATATEVPGQCEFQAGAATCQSRCPTGYFGQCVWDQRGYIYAVQDLADARDAVPVSLSISPYASEPYTRGGETPIDITGTLTISELKVGMTYDIYRWDSAEDAFVYNDAHKIRTFTATSDTEAFEDPTKFLSSSATYYRCVPATEQVIV